MIWQICLAVIGILAILCAVDFIRQERRREKKKQEDAKL